MRLDFCVACRERDRGKLEHHHLVPLSAGGPDIETNLVTLCHVCHGKAHGYEWNNVGALTRKGLVAARVRLANLTEEERADRLARGKAVKLGAVRWDHLQAGGADRGRAAGIATRRAKASSRAADLGPILAELRADGVTTLAALAEALTARGIPTARGAAVWSPMQVKRVLDSAA